MTTPIDISEAAGVRYLHFGSDAGGERAAVIYTLTSSCKLGLH